MMRRRAFVISAMTLLGGALLLASPKAPAAQQRNNTPLAYTGEIMDATCAALGSHNAVMKEEGAFHLRETMRVGLRQQ
jgi:hypothetical protein